MEVRIELDSMGPVEVPVDALWGAVTQRSYQNFKIGQEKMPIEVIRALAHIKAAAAQANHQLGKLDDRKKDLILGVVQEIIDGNLDQHFPLSLWQTGSGTQTNMNVNEVIANRSNQIAGEILLHPNDDVNLSQSSNDTFPTAMHLAGLQVINEHLMPAFDHMIQVSDHLADQYQSLVKTGRTHLQDATPITFGQEVSGWAYSLKKSQQMVEESSRHLLEIALGGTAVGTGLNTPEGYAEAVARALAERTGFDFVTSPNKFHSLSSKDELAYVHGALKTLAGDLMKIANDVRWLASGPRCGIGEINLPANEPGSSIMPGKVNPTQCEALTMVSLQVMANDTIVSFANAQGNFELNVYMPVVINAFIQSVRILADAMNSFTDKCLVGLTANEDKMKENMEKSLMLVTRLNPFIGYNKAAMTAKKAFEDNITLKESCVSQGFLTEAEFDEIVVPEKMV